MRLTHLAPLFLSPALLAAPGYNPRPDLEEGRFLKALWEADAQLKSQPNLALAHAARSQALSALQRFPEALQSAEKSLALSNGLADAYLARGMARAGSAIQQRNFSSIKGALGAMDDLKQAAQRDARLTQAWMALGLAYQQLPGILGGSTRKALSCAENLKRVHPARGEALHGMVLSMDKRWGEAEGHFRRALTLAPQDSEVIFAFLEALGSRETRAQLGESEQRRRLSQEAKRLRSSAGNRARALEAICDALLDAGEAELAWSIAMESLNKVDAPSLMRLQLGKLSARAGIKRNEGLAMLGQVLREPLEGGSGGYAAAHWRKGQILRDLGRKAEAKNAAWDALKVDPKHPGAKKLLEELD